MTDVVWRERSEHKKIKNKNQKAGKQKTKKQKAVQFTQRRITPPKEIMDRKKKKKKEKEKKKVRFPLRKERLTKGRPHYVYILIPRMIFLHKHKRSLRLVSFINIFID